ncbi:MT-A70-domain-containing protein [Phakopsora pachyrhizi]|uniref:MT-A70-domain-containing protein n=1 Tax=Phakopsora pachyrhizi TaxID=170000 RepID=A0AAV0AGG7_PHAPC|nr:MT-A70-domain-containing protein [Phakopsora pachyrhizi]
MFNNSNNNNSIVKFSSKANLNQNNHPNLQTQKRFDLILSSKSRLKKLAYGQNYIPEEETIRNDYSLHYVLTGSRPQNNIQNTSIINRFVEYPKLRKLLQLKQSLVSINSHPPTYLTADLRPGRPDSFNLLDLNPTRFDVILIDPPLKEYVQSYPHLNNRPDIINCGGPIDQERPYWNWNELESLPVPQIASTPGFIFLWCGSGQAKDLEHGRALLSKWGYRKCEDLVWVKTNNHFKDLDRVQQPLSIFRSTKEHCLMGIRGTVRRSTDGHFVHCNVDTDVIVSEPDPDDLLNKPTELYHLIENFCLGRRRIELFGSKKSLRPGWLTIGKDCAPGTDDLESLPESQRPVPYSKVEYQANFLDSAGRTHTLLPASDEINSLRPRSPPGRIAAAIPGSPIQRGLGLGYPTGAPTMPIIGPDGTVVATTISGRNTVSHPSGGLGRGPGNALLPGMRVSGFRDTGQNRSPSRQLPHSTGPTSTTKFMNPGSHYPNHQMMIGMQSTHQAQPGNSSVHKAQMVTQPQSFSTSSPFQQQFGSGTVYYLNQPLQTTFNPQPHHSLNHESHHHHHNQPHQPYWSFNPQQQQQQHATSSQPYYYYNSSNSNSATEGQVDHLETNLANSLPHNQPSPSSQ